MNAILVSQLFQDCSKSVKSHSEDLPKPRTRSRTGRRSGSCDSRASSLDVIAENSCREESPETKVTPRNELDSDISGLNRRPAGGRIHFNELMKGSMNGHGASPPASPTASPTNQPLSREFSLP